MIPEAGNIGAKTEGRRSCGQVTVRGLWDDITIPVLRGRQDTSSNHCCVAFLNRIEKSHTQSRLCYDGKL